MLELLDRVNISAVCSSGSVLAARRVWGAHAGKFAAAPEHGTGGCAAHTRACWLALSSSAQHDTKPAENNSRAIAGCICRGEDAAR